MSGIRYSYSPLLEVTILLLLIIIIINPPPPALADFLSPFLNPIFGKACEDKNVCGKGKCVKADNTTLGYACQCEDGWKQFRLDSDDDHHHHPNDSFSFLPCVIPNCTLKNTCGEAPPPSSASHEKTNLTIFDACFWRDCGGGHCNSTAPFQHTCVCQEGYSNLFNSTAFPCYKDCALGLDCKKLGLGIMNTTDTNKNPQHSVADDTNANGAGLKSGVNYSWLITMLTTWGFIVWIYS